MRWRPKWLGCPERHRRRHRFSRIERANDQTIWLSWPATAATFFLEESDLTGPDALWEPSLLEAILNGTQFSASFDIDAAARYFRLRQEIQSDIFTVVTHTPMDGAQSVGVTVKPQVFFSQAVDPATLTSESVYAMGAGKPLGVRAVPSKDRRSIWLFFEQPMPGASQVEVTLDGTRLRAADDGSLFRRRRRRGGRRDVAIHLPDRQRGWIAGNERSPESCSTQVRT